MPHYEITFSHTIFDGNQKAAERNALMIAKCLNDICGKSDFKVVTVKKVKE